MFYRLYRYFTYDNGLRGSDRVILNSLSTITKEEKAELKLLNIYESISKANKFINFVMFIEYSLSFGAMYLAIVGSFTSVKYTIVGLLLTGLLFYLIQETRTFLLTKFIKHKIKKH